MILLRMKVMSDNSFNDLKCSKHNKEYKWKENSKGNQIPYCEDCLLSDNKKARDFFHPLGVNTTEDILGLLRFDPPEVQSKFVSWPKPPKDKGNE